MMISNHYKRILVAMCAPALFACFDAGTGSNAPAQSGNSPLEGQRNNSDRSKPNYHERTAAENAYFQWKIDMLAKAESEADVHAPLAKAASTGTVGILNNSNWGSYTSSDIEIFMDTENDGNADEIHSYGSSTNWAYGTGVRRESANHGGMRFRFQKLNLSSLPVTKFDYVLPLFSETCPTNGYRFGEVFDNEDADNQDFATSDPAPGWSRRDWTGTRLEFCFVPGDGVSTAHPPWYDDSKGGFTGQNKDFGTYCNYPYYSWEEALMDGEDDGFDGHFEWESMPAEYQTRIQSIMNITWGAPHFYINSCHIPVGVQK